MKKLILLTLVLTLLLSLAACGGGEPSSATAQNGSTAPSSAPEETPVTQVSFPDGGTFDGDANGSGSWVYDNFRYEGTFVDGVPNGEGTLYQTLPEETGGFYPAQSAIMGNWKNGLADGEILYNEIFSDGQSFTYNFVVADGFPPNYDPVPSNEDEGMEFYVDIVSVYGVPGWAEVETDPSLPAPESREVVAGMPHEGVDNGFSYIYDNTRGLMIMGYDGSETDLVIPAEVAGWPVGYIHGFSRNSTLISVTIESAKTIGGRAFAECPNLKTVIFPDNLEAIEAEAFISCPSLESAMIPSDSVVVDASAFLDSPNVETGRAQPEPPPSSSEAAPPAPQTASSSSQATSSSQAASEAPPPPAAPAGLASGASETFQLTDKIDGSSWYGKDISIPLAQDETITFTVTSTAGKTYFSFVHTSNGPYRWESTEGGNWQSETRPSGLPELWLENPNPGSTVTGTITYKAEAVGTYYISFSSPESATITVTRS